MAAQEAFVVSMAPMWVVKVNGRQVGSGHDTQAGAIATARTWLQNTGGGALVVLTEKGDLRGRDTVYPGDDPRNSRA